MVKMKSVAVLLTCYNRKEKTLKCLKKLFDSEFLSKKDFEVFLVDDASTDGTGSDVMANFPEVNIINGNGNLFWNRGMRLAWRSAVEYKNFDFYLWLNDDTFLFKDGLYDIFKSYCLAKKKEGNEVIIVASCQVNSTDNLFSYGGRDDNGPIIPNGFIQACKYINGNVVLIPKLIFKTCGNLSNDYTHGMGDFDYGLNAALKGFKSYTTTKYVAYCQPNNPVPEWCNPNNSLMKRWSLFHSPYGLNILEYIKFRKKFWGSKWIFYLIKAYLKMLFPSFYFKLSK